MSIQRPSSPLWMNVPASPPPDHFSKDGDGTTRKSKLGLPDTTEVLVLESVTPCATMPDRVSVSGEVAEWLKAPVC